MNTTDDDRTHVTDAHTELGVPRHASEREIKSAWRRLAAHRHPDRNAHPRAAERMQRINRAYRQLTSDADADTAASPDDDGHDEAAAAEPAPRLVGAQLGRRALAARRHGGTATIELACGAVQWLDDEGCPQRDGRRGLLRVETHPVTPPVRNARQRKLPASWPIHCAPAATQAAMSWRRGRRGSRAGARRRGVDGLPSHAARVPEGRGSNPLHRLPPRATVATTRSPAISIA